MGGFTINKKQLFRLGIYIIISVLLVGLIFPSISAIFIFPGYFITIGNVTYTVHTTMDFSSITIDSDYIIFNNTGFYVTSPNEMLLTLVYLNNNIVGAGDGEKVLEFYADTVSGNVLFNIFGFPIGNNYIVKRSNVEIANISVDSSGYISFSNSVWSSQLFEIFQLGEGVINSPPVVSNIPDQSIVVGDSFNQISLDNFVSDIEDSDENIVWSYSGNSELMVSIVNRIATVSVPYSDWSGVESITFTAVDSGGFSDSDVAVFRVDVQSVPVFSRLSVSNGESGVSIGLSSLSVVINDPNDDLIDWTIETSPNIGSSSGDSEANGRKSCSVSGLVYSTTYKWFVNATDGYGWNRKSYSFTTESKPSSNPPSSSPPPYSPPDSPPPSDNDSEPVVPSDNGSGGNNINGGNNQPGIPVISGGPSLIEPGVDYSFECVSIDIDGDLLRYRFDWGDGNISNWSDFVSSNTSVLMSHYWNSSFDNISNYGIRVVAQDVNGLNSSWSNPFNVTVSKFTIDEFPDVELNISRSELVNNSVVFDVLEFYIGDGAIVSCYWDFGDGGNSSDFSSEHVYSSPGEYNVTLIMKDDKNVSYLVNLIMNVDSEVEDEGFDESIGFIPFDFGKIFIGFAFAIPIFLVIYFKKDIKTIVSTRVVPVFSNLDLWDRTRNMKLFNGNLRKVGNVVTSKMEDIQSSIMRSGLFSEKIKLRYDAVSRYVDSDLSSNSKDIESLDDLDNSYTKNILDDLVISRLEEGKLSDEESDSVEKMVDSMIISKIHKEVDDIN